MSYKTQDPKYNIEMVDEKARIVNAATGVPIPMDEPVFIFRAKDSQAIPALIEYYKGFVLTGSFSKVHAQAILARIEDFQTFMREHSDRMKYPDTEA